MIWRLRLNKAFDLVVQFAAVGADPELKITMAPKAPSRPGMLTCLSSLTRQRASP